MVATTGTQGDTLVTTGHPPPHDTEDTVRDLPPDVSFFSLLRLLSAQHADAPRPGYALRPQDEYCRLGQLPSLAFAPREVASVSDDPVPQINVFGLGMLGPNGPLPLHVTELAKDRLDNHHDPVLKDFLDMFHHRALMLFYRAWADAQATTGLDRAADEPFARYIASLCGTPPECHSSALPTHALLSYAPFLHRAACDPDALACALHHYFAVPVTIEEHLLHWLPIPAEDHTRLGAPSPSSQMGSALLGNRIADRHLHFRIHLGPMPLERYHDFVPHGRSVPALIALVRALVPPELGWQLSLHIAPDTILPPLLGTPLRLGLSTWLGQPDTQAPVGGVTYFPEQLSAA